MLLNHVPDISSGEHWPSASPDLNPLGYKLRTILEDMVCHNRYPNIESLKQFLTRAVTNFPVKGLNT